MIIPAISIQDSALDVISEVENQKVVHDSFWVGWEDISNDIEVYNLTELRSTGAIDVKKRNNNQLSIIYEQDKSAIVQFPNKKLTNYQSSQSISKSLPTITTIDVSPDGEFLLVGNNEGGLDVLSVKDRGKIIRSLSGHKVHTTLGRFFPSGKVALSIGLDFEIKIWNIIDGSNTKSLTRGHKDHITDIGIIERGRNIVSGSKDSTVKLWELSKGIIGDFNAPASVTALSILGETNLSPEIPDPNSNESKYGVDGKIVAIAMDSLNTISSWDLRTNQSAFKIQTENPISCISSQNNYILICGDTKGQLSTWDIRNPSTSLSSINRSSNIVFNSLTTTSNFIIFSGEGETDSIKLNLSSPNNFDLSTCSPIHLIGGTEPINSTAYNHLTSTTFVAGKQSTIFSYQH